MEYEGVADYFDYYEINYEGLNGQLPNLDLLNTANTVGHHENLQCSIQSTPANQLLTNTYFSRLRVLFRGILNLALAGLNRNTPGCEAFSGWLIQAFTVKARGTSGPADVTQFGRIVDSTFRSVNNLLEKFHQSFFFYLMLAPNHFVSIGTYLPSAILIAVAFAISSFGCLLNSGLQMSLFLGTFNKLLIFFTSVESVCFTISILLPYLVKLSANEEKLGVNIVLYGLIYNSVAISISPNFNIPSLKKYKLSKELTYMLISMSLFWIALLITTLLIVHFALALSIGFFALPLTFIQPIITNANLKSLGKANNSKYLSKIKVTACLVMSSPIFIIYLIGNVFIHEDQGPTVLMRGLLTSWNELQCWTWFIIILGWLPAWLIIALSCIIGDFEMDQVELNLKKSQ